MDWLRHNSGMKRQRVCGLRTLGDTVGVSTKNGKVGIHGTMRCGSRVCPCCSESLSRQVRDNIMAGVSTHRAAGGLVAFATFTLRHNRSQSLAELADAVAACWAAATGGRGWLRDRLENGVEHYVRVWEQKWSAQNGWHVHVHVLLFIHPAYGSTVVLEDLLGSMFQRWTSKALDLGLGRPLLRAQDIRAVDNDKYAADIAGYLAKQVTSESDDFTAGDMAFEMSNPNGKGGVGLTPAQILERAMTGDLLHLALWREYERTMKGRRAVAYSRDYRAAFDLGRELSVDELAARDEELAGVMALEIRARSYRVLVQKRGRRAEMAGRLLRDGPAATVDWIREVGADIGVPLDAWVGTRDRVPTVAFVFGPVQYDRDLLPVF